MFHVVTLGEMAENSDIITKRVGLCVERLSLEKVEVKITVGSLGEVIVRRVKTTRILLRGEYRTRGII